MKRYRPIHYILTHALLALACISIFFSIYNINYYVQNYSTECKKYTDTYEYHQMYMKYIERLTFYIHYMESGYTLDMYSPIDMEDILKSNDDSIESAHKNEDEQEQKNFEFYNYCLNISPTNFLYYVVNTDTDKVYASPFLSILYPDNVKKFTKKIQKNPSFFIFNSKTGKYTTNVNLDYNILNNKDLSWMTNVLSDPIYDAATNSYKRNHYLVYTGIYPELSNDGDLFYSENLKFTTARNLYDMCTHILPIACVVLLFELMLLIIETGKSQNKSSENVPVNGVYLNFFDRIYLEVSIVILFVIFFLIAWFINSCHDEIKTLFRGPYRMLAFNFTLIYPFALAGFLSAVRRIKSKTIFTNSILYKVCNLLLKQCHEFFLYHRITYRLTAFLLVFFFIQGATFYLYWQTHIRPLFVIGVLSSFAYLSFILVRLANDLGNVISETKKIQAGDMNHKIASEAMLAPVNELASYINNISAGLSVAVDERTKSERFKAELITNVSHDIKTPLTSIINYVDLLSKQKLENEKANEYLKILSNKSWRLKTLIEDLVEASKASSGAIKMNPQKLNLIELIKQAAGEFDDRFHENELDLVITAPPESILIFADGRSTFRIIDNLFSNINKYAMHNTRVYLDVTHDDIYGIMSIKNVSRERLNISVNELMERFVRGDASRNTEGSGLGLSISRSLTTLQNGTFDIEVDGDLFKVTLKLPLIIPMKD